MNEIFEKYLFLDGKMILNIVLYNNFSSIGDNSYFEICGGFIEGVIQWSHHNIDYIEETCNKKYTGFVIYFNNGAIRRIYIENWVLYIEPKNWQHCKNLFSKYIRQDYKYNVSIEANTIMEYN